MREPYAEGLATHGGPESCGYACEDVSEALTGVRAGRAMSRERYMGLGCRGRGTVPKATPTTPQEARGGGPDAVEDPRHARKRLAREPGDPVTAPAGMANRGRGGKSEDAIHR